MLKLIFHCCIVHALVSLAVASSTAEPVVIDTDAGADDAGAILLLLRAERTTDPRFKVAAITCSYGNTAEKNVEVNVLKTLTVANRGDIPVYAGASKPLMENFQTDEFFGDDAFGEAEFGRRITARVDRSKIAAMALIELSKKHEGNLSVLILGPTTNAALAASLDPGFVGRVKQFYVSGGAVTGRGNLRPNVEFNFAADPEANFILLNSTRSSQMTLMPWDILYDRRSMKNWRQTYLGRYDSPYVRFLNAIERVGLSRADVDYTPTDLSLAAMMLRPDLATTILDTNVLAVFDGAARGSMLVDYMMKLPRNARTVTAIDGQLFRKMLVYYFSCEHIDC